MGPHQKLLLTCQELLPCEGGFFLLFWCFVVLSSKKCWGGCFFLVLVSDGKSGRGDGGSEIGETRVLHSRLLLDFEQLAGGPGDSGAACKG